MQSETEKNKKIEETVIGILKDANLEEATEFKVRTMASQMLGFDLSGNLDDKQLVRRVVDSYLLSLGEQVLHQQAPKPEPNNGGRVICKLSEKRGVAVHDFRGNTLVSFRDYYQKDGKLLPSARGISLSTKQWSAFRKSIPDIESVIVKMESQIRSKYTGKQFEADMPNSETAFPIEFVPMDVRQFEADISNSVTASTPQGLIPVDAKQSEADISNSVAASVPQGLIPVETKQNESDISNFVTASAPQVVIPMETKQIEADKVKEQTIEVLHEQGNKKEASDGGSQVICKLSEKRGVAVHDFRGKTLVSFRNYLQKDGNLLPYVRAISLSTEEWSIFRKSVPDIEAAITKMESQIRSKDVGKSIETAMLNTKTAFAKELIPVEVKQIETDISNYATASLPQGLIPMETEQSEADISNAVAAVPPQGLTPMETNQSDAEISNSVTAFAPQGLIPMETKQIEADMSSSVTTLVSQGLIPIQTIRLDGKNYHCWVKQMEFFLKQLKIAYVLSEACPSIPVSPELSFKDIAQAKAAVQKWVDDDYICHQSILNSLSDHLFHQYSKKSEKSAKELWEELKSAYDENFGTGRSQVNKYIQFQMVDGIPILEQVQELHNIADSIIASGMWIDENFHVSAIISKLPPSWKEYRMKLMHEDFLPLHTLMYCLRVEESRNHALKGESFMKRSCVGDSRRLENRLGPNIIELKKPKMQREMEKANKLITCYKCGKKGHTSRNCQHKKVYVWQKSSKESVVPIVAEANAVERIIK